MRVKDSQFTGRAKKELSRIHPVDARRILHFIRESLAGTADPRQHGKPLKGRNSELWRYRVGDHRLVCHLQDERLLVLVVRIGHRREVYR
jgi:mRNA interferase RelE/StbE